jgi:hypothetical protein
MNTKPSSRRHLSITTTSSHSLYLSLFTISHAIITPTNQLVKMGNKIAMEMNDTFDEVKTFTVHDISQGTNKNKVVLGREYVAHDTDKILLHLDYNKGSEDDPSLARSVASDSDGYIVYADKVVVTKENKKRIMIYKPSPVFPNQRPAKDMRTSKGDPNNVYLAAVVFHHKQCACLCVVTGESQVDDTGCELKDLYKAIKNPNVKNGILVADMEGRAVGKTSSVRIAPKRSSSSSSFASASSMGDSVISASTTSSFSSSLSSFLGKGGEKGITYEVAAGAHASAVITVAASLFN